MRQGSFLRKGVAQSADSGTRPGLHGQTLISSGHPDLDRLLGGGVPLGSLLLLLEDGWSGHHATLIRYFLAEGAACGQTLLLAAAPTPLGGLFKYLPAQLRGKAAEKDEEEGGKEQEDFKLRIAWQYRRYIKTASSRAGSIPVSLSPGSSPGLGSTVGGRSGGGQAAVSSGGPSSSSSSGGAASRKPAGLRDWCHRFDLLRSAGEEGLLQCQAQLLDCGSRRVEQPSGDASVSSGTQYLLSQAAAFVQSLAPQQPAAAEQAAPAAMAAAGAGARAPPAAAPTPRGPQHVGRIAVLSLGSPGWRTDCLAVGADSSNPAAADGSSWRQGSLGGKQAAAATAAGPVSGAAIVQWLLQLKGLVRDQRCAVVVSVPAAQFSAADVARMQHFADCVVAFESVADDSDIARLAPDPASVAGLLHLRKLPSLGAAAAPVPEVALHLVRHKRRRLAITPVEIDPEAELADAEAASGAGKTAAAVLCGGPTSGGRQASLEF
ncbi:hypothetical protein D9Q98_005431 [Chlorella vulgaris]|uniref:Elongator complex protein 4 n=1 Tax=Chlorella vulgaris TaxID=3077 RepID=A0A9D4YVX3_CHLVU|nr:hypothetical protein D9Q98_005431 [Chlorella vulgaris]